MPRAAVSLPVLISASGRRLAAKLHNLSRGGALVEAGAALSQGSRVVLSCGTIETDATVVWTADRTFGIRFAAPVNDAVVQQQLARSEAMSSRRPAAS